jgi:hypothetical protein
MLISTRREIHRRFEHAAGTRLDARAATCSVAQSLADQLRLCRALGGGPTG